MRLLEQVQLEALVEVQFIPVKTAMRAFHCEMCETNP